MILFLIFLALLVAKLLGAGIGWLLVLAPLLVWLGIRVVLLIVIGVTTATLAAKARADHAEFTRQRIDAVNRRARMYDANRTRRM